MTNQVNRKKILHSKWTAVRPQNKEKHFTVTHVELDKDDPQVIISITITAEFTNKNYKIDYRELKNSLKWKQGWA